jgi:hypothetical protein
MFDTPLEDLADELESQIIYCNDIDYLDKLAVKYGHINHPHIGYRIGEKYLLLDTKERGVNHLLNSASFGLNPTNEYLITGYADSIGQSMWYLIKYYDYLPTFDIYKYNLYCSAYFCLSQCINGMGVNAYDSLRTRALMIDNFDGAIIRKMLAKYYYEETDTCTQMLSISDYFLASEGYKNIGNYNISAECLKWARENMDYMVALPQYKPMSLLKITDVAHISTQNQDYVVKNLSPDFKNGVFQMTAENLRLGVTNYRVKSRTRYGEWI